METKKVLVTGIGGNVGQGIIRNIRMAGLPIKVVGCNVLEFSAGSHLCDAFYKVPYAYDEQYISAIIRIVEQEHIDLVIPSTDYEVYYLAKNIGKINCEVAVSEEKTAQVYLDKYSTYLHHVEYDIPFAKSFLPSEYDNSLNEFLVKPREGRGSRGIYIQPEHPQTFSDEYMVQELFKGLEITTAFYVNKVGQLHGFITLNRSLENGATSQCEVTTQFDIKIELILKRIIAAAHIKGSANLQSIVTSSGDIIPFEVNCRISGTNSIRSQFGFEDVKYTLQEYLYNELPDKPNIRPGIATRILMDVIYPGATDISKLMNNSSPFYLF